MAAANTDKARKQKSQVATTLSAGISDSDTSTSLASASGFPTDTAVTLTINRVDANGTPTPTLQERVVGTVNGNTIENLVRAVDGGSAKAHSAGAVVEFIWDADTWNDLIDAFLVEHANGATSGQHDATKVASLVSGAMDSQWDGWIVDDNAWTSPSFADSNGESTLSVTVPSDATTKYQPGMRVKFTQDATERQGIITKVAATQLTIFINTDFTPTANAITLPHYSSMKAPYGFDLDPNKYTVETTAKALSAQATPNVSQWYNVGGHSLWVPIGAWEVEWEAPIYQFTTGGLAGAAVLGTLSKASNTEDDSDFTDGTSFSFTGTPLRQDITRKRASKTLVLTAADEYYLNAMTTTASVGFLRTGDAAIPLFIRATLAYL